MVSNAFSNCTIKAKGGWLIAGAIDYAVCLYNYRQILIWETPFFLKFIGTKLFSKIFWKFIIGQCPFIGTRRALNRDVALFINWPRQKTLSQILSYVSLTLVQKGRNYLAEFAHALESQSRKDRGCLGLISNMEIQFRAIWAALKELLKKTQLWIMSFWARFFHVFMV